ncbi:G-type lectin S-receptor-like serine/threonine-protein kinase LECRK2 [Elaeis guineensis]|uniref:Receptor-like serine/threonine-protein kinase n=1 Tax=Elaeis guineensis var. tenera TaxID=51953 RepID=A0A6I9QJI7_ELAGV|nr:G-type lectin S-receptor-like serine/threonine-protein kinase LECRK2 [Elaeis guineensis]
MASATSYLLFLSIFSSVLALEAAQPRQSNINLESSLHPSTNPTSWLSPNGRFAIGFYPEGSGYFVGIWFVTSDENTTIIWTAERDGPPVSKDAVLKLTSGGLELEGRSISQFSMDSYASSASMLDSGNFVIYGSNLEIIWQTFDIPTDTIVAGQMLPPRSELISSISETNHSSGKFRLEMQHDANLVLYPMGTLDDPEDAYWSTNTGENPNLNLSLHFSNDGRLYLLGHNFTRNITTAYQSKPTLVYRATLDIDGRFKLYSHDFKSNATEVLAEFPDSADQCKVKGTCGSNSYCSSAAGPAVCSCLPGFYFLDANRTSNGCTRNFTGDGCSLNYDRVMQNMSTLENLVWVIRYGAPDSITNKEDCKKKCLEECKCDAALFNNNTCSMLKFPLEYGYEDENDATTTFIKVVTISPEGGRQSPAAVPITAMKKKFRTKIWIVSLAIIAGLSCTVDVFALFIYRSHRMLGRNRELGLVDEIAPRCFSYHELREATDDFKEQLGKGAFGTVFKGSLSNGERAIAVKRLERMVDEGEREFQTEMRTIGRTHHKNLVRLLGFCDEGPNKLLVYECMSNGSLADLIFKTKRRLYWDDRVRIALDVARGILYLHEECDTRIIHCDIKPQNILMDDNWTAKLSDFGLAKLLTPSQTRTFTCIRGTRGYLAPEWHKNAPITVKADVYSFGIVLLEIVCCRKNMELEAEVDAIVLLDWVSQCFASGELEKLISDEVDMTELDRLVKVGLWCTQSEPALRPAMKNVVMMLEGNIEVSLPPRPDSSS